MHPYTLRVRAELQFLISGIPDKNYEAKQLLGIPVLCGWDLMSLLAYRMGEDAVRAPILNYCTFDPHAYSVCKYILKYMGVIDNAAVRPPNPDAGEARASEAYEVLKRVGALEPAPAP